MSGETKAGALLAQARERRGGDARGNPECPLPSVSKHLQGRCPQRSWVPDENRAQDVALGRDPRSAGPSLGVSFLNVHS